MSSRQLRSRILITTALLASARTGSAQTLAAPVPAASLNSHSAAPAVALTPVPMSEYVLQQPPTPVGVPIAAPSVEQTGYAPVKLPTPTVSAPVVSPGTGSLPMPAPIMKPSAPVTANRIGPMLSGVGTLSSPGWRWYGWGAPAPQGFSGHQTGATTTPAPNYSAPAISPPINPPVNPPVNMPISPPVIKPSAPIEMPKVNVPVVPMMDPVDLEPAANAPKPAPPTGAPAIDLTSPPKPVPAPAETGPAVEPWNGASAKVKPEWRTVRASSK